MKLSSMKEVLFFFSSVSTSLLNGNSKGDKDADDDGSQANVVFSQLSRPGKQVHPAFTYWVACQTSNSSTMNLQL